ncbi:lambda-crystallin homolog isoform X1 [Ruditapes philippinarum]|uniref:lambda-crystallin homolog isoform X1 n=1 Tax=Ruditapes philippinarum TaxID=129788 RepID=UPI00295C2902|nr:lambda-crystallin homolog isoform X1 [Ruditapes philippinarum]
MAQDKSLAIIGCGLVGQSWAIVFSTAKFHVRIFDNMTEKLEDGLASIKRKMEELEEKGCLRGSMSAAEALTFIKATPSMEQCVAGASYVQECVFENIKLKRSVFEDAEKYASKDVILASSTGNIFPSRLSEGMKLKDRIIVSHPINPPHLVPLVEIIAAPWTDPTVVTQARTILEDAGQVPIVAKKETAGFIMCRIQHTITAECFKLIRDDVISVADLDKLIPHGLGLRYAFMGALETCYLNANGMKDFCSMYADPLYELQKQSGPPIMFEGSPLEKIQEELEQQIPLDKIEQRREWRDRKLAELYKLKNKAEN